MYFEQLRISLRALIVLSVITGLGYPLAMTGISQLLFPRQANGSLIVDNGHLAGSDLIGQSFDAPKYFWGRLSATGSVAYNGASSSGSNLGPLNPALTKAAEDRINALRVADPANASPVPVDLVTASASGLDPHITPAAAHYQLRRVAALRGLSEKIVQKLIDQNTTQRFLGILGEPTVNVLKLNLALDRTQK